MEERQFHQLVKTHESCNTSHLMQVKVLHRQLRVDISIILDIPGFNFIKYQQFIINIGSIFFSSKRTPGHLAHLAIRWLLLSRKFIHASNIAIVLHGPVGRSIGFWRKIIISLKIPAKKITGQKVGVSILTFSIDRICYLCFRYFPGFRLRSFSW